MISSDSRKEVHQYDRRVLTWPELIFGSRCSYAKAGICTWPDLTIKRKGDTMWKGDTSHELI